MTVASDVDLSNVNDHEREDALHREIARLRELIAAERIECARIAEEYNGDGIEIADLILKRPVVTYGGHCHHRWDSLPDPSGGHFVACIKCNARRHVD